MFIKAKNQYFPFLSIFFLFILFFLGNFFCIADDFSSKIYKNEFSAPLQVFVRENCKHCNDEKEFFKQHSQDLQKSGIQIRFIDINANFSLFQEFSDRFNVFGTPITLAGNRIFQGYDNDETGNRIIEAYTKSKHQFSVEQALKSKDIKIQIFLEGSAPVCIDESNMCSLAPKTIRVPFLGETKITGATIFTRYISSFLLGFFDGFNPCAMWVLTIFLIALMQVGDRVKMFFVAGTFILAEAIMYGLILVVWWKFFNIFSVQYDRLINVIVGIVAIGAGGFFIYEGFFSDGTCKITNIKQQRSISQKISTIAHSPITLFSFLGILMLAFSVNIIEFACSAGYPQIFSKILMPSFTGDFINQMGILLTYLSAYMLDDIIVFGIALYSVEKIGITQKYAKIFNVLGGSLMAILGILMLFFPNILKEIF